MIIGRIINKYTDRDVCPQYTFKPVREFIDDIGKELKVTYEDGSFFTHEIVVSHDQDDYGFWIETTNKLWRFDNY
jgi:hypothetical protein